MMRKICVFGLISSIFAFFTGVACGGEELLFAAQEGAPVPEIGVLTATNSVEWDMVSRGIDEIGVRFKADDVLPSSAVIRWKGGEHYYFQRLDLSGATVGDWVDCSFSLEGLEDGGWGGGGRSEEDFEQDLRQFQEVQVQVCRRGMGEQRYEVKGFYRAKDGAVVTRDIFTVSFMWHGGSSESEWEYGEVPELPEVPEKGRRYVESGVIHTFAGWTPAVSAVTDDATYTATYDEAAVVAQIAGGEVYPSLAAAVAAAEPGATVVLQADDDISFAEGGVVIDKDIVIDGAGFTVKGVSNADIHNVTAKATPPDVEFDGVEGSNVRGFFVKAGNVTFTNLVMTEFGDTDYVNKFGYTPIQTASAYDGTLTVADVDIDKFNRTAICIRGGTFSISGGTITANAANRDVETLGKDHFQQPIEIRGGTGTIDGVTVTSEGYPYDSNGGGAIVAWSDVTIRDVTIDFTGVGIWSDYADIVVEGENTSVAATDKVLFVEDGGSIAVAAGGFAGELAVDAVEGSSIVVNGGTFDAPVPTEFVGDGLAPTTLADADGKYTVRTARTVTFDANGGTAVEAVVVADGEPVSAPDPAPEKQYFTLRAWQLSGEDYDFATPVTADIELVAAWARKQQTVTFDPSPYGTFRGEPTLEMTFEIGGTYHDLPGTTPDGTHARIGWYTMPDGEGGEPVADGDAVTGGATLTLYAHWTDKQTVTFDAQNETDPSTKVYTVGGRYGTLPRPTWAGHAFLGWYTAAEGGKHLSATSIVTTRPTRTMYAHWTTEQTVVFDAQGGACEPGTMSATIGGRYGSLPKPTKAGHAFVGWYTAAEGGKHLTANSIVTTLDTRTFYAHWTDEQTVIFDAQGGACEPATMIAEMGGRYGALPKPTKAGYAFVGWYTKAEGGNHLTANSIVTTLNTRTFYAHWTTEQTVTFDAQGGTCDPGTMVATVGEAYGALPVPEKEGQKFLGWYTKAEGGSKVSAASVVTAVTKRTLYAHWKESAGTLSISGFSRSVRAGTLARDAKFDADEYTLSFETEAGVTYEVQWTAELGGEWTTLKSWTAEEDGEMAVTVTVPAGANTGFFRLVAQEAE